MIQELEFDKPRDECGVFGIFNSKPEDITNIMYYGLYALQHRGQESAGIAVSNGENINLLKDMGLVAEVFDDEKLKKLEGNNAIGHVRYSTTGSSLAINAQPFVFNYSRGMVAIAHNGNLVNASSWRKTLGESGSVFQSTSDTEVIINLMARYGQNTIEEAIMKCMIDIKGAYALLLMTGDKLVGVRDPHGLRPLCIGKKDGAYILSSESCALDTVGAKFVRDVKPGEIVIIDKEGLRSIHGLNSCKRALCSFELIYLARTDSVIDNKSVIQARQRMGKQLAKQKKIDADIVVPVPDSGIPAAYGYSKESGILLQEGLVKNRYVGRTFIQPTQKLRELAVRLKLNPIRSIIEGKRVVLVDDSIVRGTTSKKIIKLVKDAGAKEVHMVISSPPIFYPCYYGIDTSGRGELIANEYKIDEICKKIGADSLTYLTLDGLKAALGGSDYCTACFDGSYPIEIREKITKGFLEGAR